MSYCFKITTVFWLKYAQKCVTFIENLQKLPSAGSSASRPPLLPVDGANFAPRLPMASGDPDPRQNPSIEKSWLRHWMAL